MSSKRRPMATIPEPYENLSSLRTVALATKELVEVMSGQRGDPMDVAVTWQDLVDLELVIKAEVPEGIGSPRLQRTS